MEFWTANKEEKNEEKRNSSNFYFLIEEHRRNQETEKNEFMCVLPSSNISPTQKEEIEETNYDASHKSDNRETKSISFLPNFDSALNPIFKKSSGTFAEHKLTQERNQTTSSVLRQVPLRKGPVMFDDKSSSEIKQVERQFQEKEKAAFFKETEKQSEEQQRRKLINFFNKQLTLIRTAGEIKADDIQLDDPEREAKILKIHQDTFSKITKQHEAFLKKLDENPSLENQEILLHSVQALHEIVKNLPQSSIDMASSVAIFQKIYPRFRNQYESFLTKIDSSLSNESPTQVADHAIMLLELAFKTFDPQEATPIKVRVYREGAINVMLAKRNIPQEPLLVNASRAASDFDDHDMEAILIAESMLDILKKIKTVFTASSENVPMALCESRYLVASHNASLAYKKTQELVKKLQAAKPLTEEEQLKVYDEPIYKEASAYFQKCSLASTERTKEFMEQKPPIHELDQANKIARNELWNMANEAINVADSLVRVLNDRTQP